MSESYSPLPELVPGVPYSTGFLSQRDLGLRIPLNYVTSPGVTLTAACFPYDTYDDVGSGGCLSNLFAVGFRRFEIDVYWDEGRGVWSFCPVSVPSVVSGGDENGGGTVTVTSGRVVGSSSAASSTASTTATSANTSAGLSLAPESTSASTASLESAQPTVAVIPDSTNEPLYQIGPYTCTSTINLSAFTSLLLDYIETTENDIAAHMIYVTINLHAAANTSTPTLPASEPSTMPAEDGLLGTMFMANISNYMYTPTNLINDRANLNSSWYTVNERYRPVDGYYATSKNEQGILSTQDGWPSESYVELSKSKRLLVEFGTVDPQMVNYNFTGDAASIFPGEYLKNNIVANINATDTGGITSGCYLLSSPNSVARTNNSWAVASSITNFNYATTASSDLNSTLALASNLTSCGISPILNSTLFNASAQTGPYPYQNYSYATTFWAWSSSQPENYTAALSDAASDSLFRCASSSIVDGKWVVTDCSQKLFAACRYPSQPYNWTVTTYQISYSYAALACPSPAVFDAPRTALENAYLLQATAGLARDRDFDGHNVWVDFNSLDVEACWVTGGPNATCPYYDYGDDTKLKEQTVLVPTIAAIIVVVVGILTVLAKAAGNRKMRKRGMRRRRGSGGVHYEGVPS